MRLKPDDGGWGPTPKLPLHPLEKQKKTKTSNFTSFAVKKKNLQKWFKRCFLENLHGVVLLTWREQFKFDMERKKLLRRKIGFFHFYQKMFGGYEWGKKNHLNLSLYSTQIHLKALF